jgi:sulfatase maturation enzyme AslB (radical SAM superfamily)
LIYKLRKEHPELSRFELEKLLPTQLIVQDSLELNYGTNCSTTCTYCYLDRFSRKSGKYDETKLYPFSYTQYDENLRKFLKFLEVNKMTPISIDLFGGDVIFNRYGLLTLDVLYEHYSNLPIEYRPFEIVIPTNGTWISVDSLTER